MKRVKRSAYGKKGVAWMQGMMFRRVNVRNKVVIMTRNHVDG
ncbi:hypothetical protein Hanom_Chr12g01091141 [Helianthus anomalus]